MNRRTHPLLIATVVLVFVWVAVWAGYAIARNSKMTAEKVRRYVDSVNFARLSGEERAQAIRKLEDKVNALSLEERRRWRRGDWWSGWFSKMTEEERAQFIDETLPTGFKQMMDAFEELPADKRKRAIENAMKSLRENQRLPLGHEPGQGDDAYGTNGPPPFSPELEKRILAVGLKSFYDQSKAQTKAEVAPVIEELQHQMQTGRPFR